MEYPETQFFLLTFQFFPASEHGVQIPIDKPTQEFSLVWFTLGSKILFFFLEKTFTEKSLKASGLTFLSPSFCTSQKYTYCSASQRHDCDSAHSAHSLMCCKVKNGLHVCSHNRTCIWCLELFLSKRRRIEEGWNAGRPI